MEIQTIEVAFDTVGHCQWVFSYPLCRLSFHRIFVKFVMAVRASPLTSSMIYVFLPAISSDRA